MFLIGAALFDKLDGAVARRLGLTEPLPGEPARPHGVSLGSLLDDISDGVSFCIAPAWIFHHVMSDVSNPMIQGLPYGWVALLYGLAGIARLIYFTLDKTPVPGFFKGMPTPAAALLVMAPMIILSQNLGDAAAWDRFWGLASFGLMIFAAIVMNTYPVRYLHIGRFMSRHPWFGRVCLLLLCSIFTPFYGYAFLLVMLLYTLSPLVTWRIDPREAAKETRRNHAGAH
jgi:phosphatidylserine synthase